jgi:hypothetical protein
MAARQYGFTDARRRLTELVDAAQREAPPIIRRRKASEDDVIVISRRLLRSVLKAGAPVGFSIKKLREKDDSTTLTLEPFGLAVNAPDQESAETELSTDAQAYAEDFMENRELYLRSANRAAHLPLVLEILSCTGRDELREVLGLA